LFGVHVPGLVLVVVDGDVVVVVGEVVVVLAAFVVVLAALVVDLGAFALVFAGFPCDFCTVGDVDFALGACVALAGLGAASALSASATRINAQGKVVECLNMGSPPPEVGSKRGAPSGGKSIK
jgi:hypothetical protein